ncbi:MAG TPA: response regulator [Pyrinomonadaceae bacterium]|nr:response regulator [Pyrinomonadaceae bacterium]
MPPKSPRYRPLVLVIDESRHTRAALRFYLVNEGYEVDEAANGHAAFESATVNPPDLVLIDLNMPGPSGVLTAQRLRSIQQMDGTPIVACAGPDSQAYRDAVRAAGCDAYITKPINPAVLMRVVRSLLHRRSVGMMPSSDVTQLASNVL